MSKMQHVKWYSKDENDDCLDPAREAFSEAVKIYSSQLTEDDRKRDIVGKAACIEDVMKSVQEAQAKYKEKHKNNKVQEQLAKFSARVNHYGKIMSVLASHHPEYVSLVWGAMQFLFTAVMNHDTLLSSLARGLWKIAESLPHIDLASLLYPTKMMKRAVAELYAYILKFLIRAQDWYTEGRVRHMIHSITRPDELRYKDLMEEIHQRSVHIDKLALACSQAEQRDMHEEITALRAGQAESNHKLSELTRLIITYQSVNSTSLVDTNQRLSDLQMSNVLSFLEDGPFADPSHSLKFSLSMRNMRRLKRSMVTKPFWTDVKFRSWDEKDSSSLIMVRGAYKRRLEVKDFCANIIEHLQMAQVPVIWALKTTGFSEEQAPTVVNLLKHLALQILRINTAFHKESSMSLNCSKFQTATSEDQWYDILACLIQGLPRLYIVVDVETLDSTLGERMTLPASLLDFCNNLSKRGHKTIIKIALVSYGSTVLSQISRSDLSDLTLLVGRSQNAKVTRKTRRQKQFTLPSRTGAHCSSN